MSNATPIMPFVFFNGEITTQDKAHISIASHSLQYGTTCFAGIRGYFRAGQIRLFRLRDHFERLMQASKILQFGFSCPFEKFEQILRQLIEKNRPTTDIYIRPFLFSRNPQLAPKPLGLQFELAIYMVEGGGCFDARRGLNVMVSSWRKFSDAALPTKAKAGGCYLNSFLASGEALSAGFDDAILLDEQGYVVEASAANIMVMRRDRIIVPPLGSALLEGITLRTVLELLVEEKIQTSHDNIDRSMLYTCDELLLLGTAAQIAFVSSVDRRHITENAGPICTLLRNKFESIISNEHHRSKEWIS
jgi:branched-chain amino acid aminotransferase